MTVPAGDNRLKGINPEKLMVVEVDEIHPMLDVQFPALVARQAELELNIENYLSAITSGIIPVIQNDAEMNRASDLYKQAMTFAHATTGEAEITRHKVSDPVFKVKQSIDAWFGERRKRLFALTGQIALAQQHRLDAVRRQEQEERAAAAARAAEVAARLLEEAKDPDAPDVAVEMAMEAESIANDAKALVGASMQDMTRLRSTTGVTTSGSEKWDFKVKDMRLLCAAVAAGKVPATFVTTADSAIKLALKGKSGMREVPGLEIYPEIKVNRRGG